LSDHADTRESIDTRVVSGRIIGRALRATLYMIAGIYGGLIVTVAGLFTENRFAEMIPPAITHPELYYNFYAVTLTWQLAFLVIAVAFVVGIGRTPTAAFWLTVPDAILGVPFARARARTDRATPPS
jgi:hypothetical protein